jgi:hypothetical protein
VGIRDEPEALRPDLHPGMAVQRKVRGPDVEHEAGRDLGRDKGRRHRGGGGHELEKKS